MDQLGPELATIWDAGTSEAGLIHCATVPALHYNTFGAKKGSSAMIISYEQNERSILKESIA